MSGDVRADGAFPQNSLPAILCDVAEGMRGSVVTLQQRHPTVEIAFFLYDVGARGGTSVDTAFGVHCFFGSGPSAQHGGVDLLVMVADSQRAPMVDFVGLAWSNADEESVLIDEPVVVSDALTVALLSELPGLLSALSDAVTRGVPPTELRS